MQEWSKSKVKKTRGIVLTKNPILRISIKQIEKTSNENIDFEHGM